MDKKKAKKILIINPGHEENTANRHLVPHSIHRDIPPVSILTLGSYLIRHGENVILLNTHLYPDYRERIRKIISDEDIAIVGITTLVGEFIRNAREITQLVKLLNPKIPVVWGGHLTSTLPEACLKEGNADYIVFFNGEEPFRLLLKALRKEMKFEDVPNIGFLKNGEIFYTEAKGESIIYNDINEWGLLNNEINVKQIPYLAYLFTSRGCPYNCRFCYNQRLMAKKGKKFFLRDAENVISEMDYLKGHYGIDVFTIGDDNFFTSKKRAVAILTAMKEKGYFLEQVVGTFSDFSDEIISSLEGVCQTAICSIETASEVLLKYLNKPINLKNIPNINRKLHQVHVNTIHNFMFGLPGETDEDRKAAVDLMILLKDINPYVRGMAYFFTPLPSTPLFSEIEKDCGIIFPKTLSFWQDYEIIGQSNSQKFRPWLKDDEQIFILEFINLFKELFKSLNEPLSEIQREAINGSPRLQFMFSNIGRVRSPEDRTPKYLLDKILRERKLID